MSKSKTKAERVLLVGGSGFLGSYLLTELNRNPKYIVVSTNTKTLDILNRAQVIKTVAKFDIVINLTGQVSNPISTCIELNSQGILHLIEACNKGGQTFIQLSTVLVYGTVDHATEESPYNPETPYSTSKVFAEILVANMLAPNKRLIIRLANLYGEHQSKGLFWYLLHLYKAKKPIHITDNDGSLRRNYVHVEDAARLIHQLIEKRAHGIINLAGNEYFSIKQLAKILERKGKRVCRIDYVSQKPLGNIGTISTRKLDKIITPTFMHSVEAFFEKNVV